MRLPGLLLLLALAGCGGGSGAVLVPVADRQSVTVEGIDPALGIFDPAPASAPDGTLYMSYSHVTAGDGGIVRVETRLAHSADGGARWQDAGVINAASVLPLPSPNANNVVTHEVSRLVHNPHAPAGTDPWILLWHRYLAVHDGTTTQRLFQHGWIGMKRGTDPARLGGERKLFTGYLYDPVNDSVLGPPEFPLATILPDELGECAAFTEPALLPRPEGVYLALQCARLNAPHRIVLLRCDHDFANCEYLGNLLDGQAMTRLDSRWWSVAAPELVAGEGGIGLLVTPVVAEGAGYRGCLLFEVTDLGSATLATTGGLPRIRARILHRGDHSGACAWDPGLTARGILQSVAVFDRRPIFGIVDTGTKP